MLFEDDGLHIRKIDHEIDDREAPHSNSAATFFSAEPLEKPMAMIGEWPSRAKRVTLLALERRSGSRSRDRRCRFSS